MVTIVERVAPCRVESCASEERVSIQVRLRFTQQHPYDIDLIMELNGKEIGATWKLGREMMDEAAHDPRSKEGEGDVTIETFCSHFTVLLHPPGANPAKLIFNRIHVREFMDKVNLVMPWDDAARALFYQLDEHPDWLKETE